MTAGIALVTMNRPGILRDTVAAIERTFRGPVVVVDNGSTDEHTLEILDRQRQKGWAIVANPENLGLSKAVNQGLKILVDAAVDIMIHMDDDALIVQPDHWLARFMKVFQECPELGLLVPFERNESIPRKMYREIRWGLGYFWLLRREAYDLTGGYDPQLLHQQECDLAIRVRMAGYTVGEISDVHVAHNDKGGARTDLSLAREHIGVVQFRDKWASYYRGLGWNYGTFPVYLMQHWPLDVEWYERFAAYYGVELTPPLPRDEHGKPKLDAGNSFTVNGKAYYKRGFPVEDGAHFETMPEAHKYDRELAIQRWKELTGEEYTGYVWPGAPLFKVRE